MLNPATLLDLIRPFIVFEKGRREDPKTGQVRISTAKKLAAYLQYYAVNAAVESTLQAADLECGIGFQPVMFGTRAGSPSYDQVAETPEEYQLPGVKQQPRGDRQAGVVWHTQGSGKSLSILGIDPNDAELETTIRQVTVKADYRKAAIGQMGRRFPRANERRPLRRPERRVSDDQGILKAKS